MEHTGCSEKGCDGGRILRELCDFRNCEELLQPGETASTAVLLSRPGGVVCLCDHLITLQGSDKAIPVGYL